MVLRILIGLLLVISSCILNYITIKQLGISWSAKPMAIGLVTKGMYSRIQHPIYCFGSLFYLGWFVIFFGKYPMIVWLLMFVYITIQTKRAIQERKLLTQVFGSKYTDYCKTTWF